MNDPDRKEIIELCGELQEYCENADSETGNGMLEIESPKIRKLVHRVRELDERDQRWVDEVVYYRNLSITLGAKPEDMSCKYDKWLCEKGLGDTDPNERTFADERADMQESWEFEEKYLELLIENQALRASLALREAVPIDE